jgi:hypothetical protein
MNAKQREECIMKSLDEIKRGLYGDKTNLQPGLISRFESIEEYIEQDKKLKTKVGGAIWVIGAIWTSLTAFVTYFVDKLN